MQDVLLAVNIHLNRSLTCLPADYSDAYNSEHIEDLPEENEESVEGLGMIFFK